MTFRYFSSMSLRLSCQRPHELVSKMAPSQSSNLSEWRTANEMKDIFKDNSVDRISCLAGLTNKKLLHKRLYYEKIKLIKIKQS